MSLPKVVVTSGEPAGIGPDIVLKALENSIAAKIVVTGDPNLFHIRAEQLKVKCQISIIDDPFALKPHSPRLIQILPCRLSNAVEAGILDPGNAGYVLDTINQAVDLCMSNTFDAMVTAPVHKGVINDSGIKFSGHTEWIAQRTKSSQPVMMLANDSFRVCLATTHLPLREVADHINSELIESVLRIMAADLNKLYKIPQPTIGVCGLNPHAGENGHLGMEEKTIIQPLLDRLNKQGFSLKGPIPADTAFTISSLKSLDGVLAMYHDQGLPVIKHSGFGEVVNVTLGLPIIRTSVDHGTALELAGTVDASETSLIAAIKLALQFAHNEK